MAAAQIAIDLVRLLGAELQLGVVQQPDIVEGVDHRLELERRRREIENLAGLYHVNAQTKVVDGNPIHEMERWSREADLLVLPFHKGRAASLTRPDVALQLVHRAHCSVLVMPC
jgi:nucleotide-binding universal stress UspA family protein